MRVAINAQLLPAHGTGGAETALIGLVHTLGQLAGPEEYLIIGPWQQPGWLAPFLGPNQRIVPGPRPRERFRNVPRLVRPLARTARRVLMNLLGSEVTWYSHSIPISDGFYEALGCDLIHFPYQHFVITGIPSVFSPYDLQHLHLPQFFAPHEIARREAIYPTGCRLAQTIIVASQWSKDDIVSQYKVDPRKIQLIPLAPPTEAYLPADEATVRAVREHYALPETFALYPAMTWPHKNHLRLLEALALLRDRDRLRVNLVCTGTKNRHWPYIQARLDELRLNDLVHFLGFVPNNHLSALYKLAQFVVIPSLFEGAGLPLLEAWHNHQPVACAATTSLIEEAANAGLMFDPYSVEAIADAMWQLATSVSLRDEYRQRGEERLRAFSWGRTAQTHRAVYRQVAGFPLSETDRALLGANWIQFPDGQVERTKDT